MEALILYKRAQAKVRKTIKIQKRTFWRQYCCSIGREVQLSDVWGMIRAMGGIRKNYELPVMSNRDKTAVSNQEKAELLVQTFLRVHSSDNLAVEARQSRNRTLMEFPNILQKDEVSENPLDLPLNMFELKRAIISARQTTPGKDGVCYKMLAHMTENTLEIILILFNQIWDTGQLPSIWKQAIIIPILKPGKDPSDPSSYRPIALTSHLCKIMERIITERITYFLESRYLLSPYQSGFRKGRNTMDSVLCLESDIRKAQTNKEVVIAVFFDVEKAYDMLWKEGLLIKLKSLGINGRTYNWVMDFLFNRKIQVRVGEEYSRVYTVENGTPQGSVCSPLLFNIMINDIFSQVEQNIGKSLYADDGALWIRGRNIPYINKKMQAAIDEVEKWTNKWGFKLSIAKTQVICFSRRHKISPLSLYLYRQQLEQVKVVRFLGVWFDEKLTWKVHLNKVKDKCKKVINMLRCLSGQEWGASRTSLQSIYWALMRSVLDYGCIAYMSAAESNLRELDVLQAQALRICSGAFKSSPVSSMQVEMGEMPLRIRRIELMMAYWVSLQGQNGKHPVKSILKECWEHNETNYTSFGWVGDAKARNVGLHQLQYSNTVPLSPIPPWLFPLPAVDLRIQQELKDNSNNIPIWYIVQKYFEEHFPQSQVIFTDGSKDPETGCAGAAVYVPMCEFYIKKRVTNHLSVYTTELLAIILALNWIEEMEINNSVIASDSFSALESIKSGRSSARMDIVYNIFCKMYDLKVKGISTQFIWVPAHTGVEGNEKVDILAKQSLRIKEIDLCIPLSKAEAKVYIRKYTQSIWQMYWDDHETGRHLYNIQKSVDAGRIGSRNRREENIITRLRIGHTGLNSTLYRIGKHPTGECRHCNQQETVEHVLLQCTKYSNERYRLFQSMKKGKSS
ncbi:uridine 5'-monophosphate synthase isoform X1 [Labeo rohita]|uniref:uridine 5'-monophosphate synthase isoform X1 n=1 Tax=Labeo rohita TaxID=84645 RepID=UPI0021E2F5DB|nr:uridine 5'-monophosphate synthase isoform X1 [Labeo rohita]